MVRSYRQEKKNLTYIEPFENLKPDFKYPKTDIFLLD